MRSTFDTIQEVRALKTMLSGSEWSGQMYSAIKENYFYNPATKAIFARLKQIVDTAGIFDLPTLDFVIADSQISDSTRSTFLQVADTTPAVTTDTEFKITVSELGKYARLRTLLLANKQSAESLMESETPTLVLREVADRLGAAAYSANEEHDFEDDIVIGSGYNQAAEDSHYRIMTGDVTKNLIKSGLEEFDKRTGGFNRTNLVILSATSGGGKSLMALNLMVRQFRLGYNVALASYEMTADEVNLRLSSCISEIPMTKFATHTLDAAEAKRAEIAWREFTLLGALNNNHMWIKCPKTETSVPEIGFKFKSTNKKPDVVYLDYLNLLTSSSGNNVQQWQQLGDIAKEAKLLANSLNCVVVLLAQLDQDFNLRYSKGIKDHANFVWGWVRDETAIQERLITIRQMKARNAPLYDFVLHERFDIAQFRDPDQEDRDSWPDDDRYISILDELDRRDMIKVPTKVMKEEAEKAAQTRRHEREQALVETTAIESPFEEAEEETVAPPNLLYDPNDDGSSGIVFSTGQIRTTDKPLIVPKFMDDTL